MIKIQARTQLWSHKIDLLISQRSGDGRLAVAQSITMTTIENDAYCEPSLSIEPTAAQMLMDELWQCGLRPSEGSGSAGSLAATEAHLKDMRAIANGLLRKDGVQV